MEAVTIDIPAILYESLRKRAEREGKTVEDLIITLLAKDLDPKHRVEAYKWLFEKYMREAQELYKKGDLLQAGEKLWGAITALLNIIGEIEGKPHYRHSDYWDLVEDIAEKTDDPEYSTLFTLAERLHANYYHNFMRPKTFQTYWENAIKLVEKLREYLKEKHGINV